MGGHDAAERLTDLFLGELAERLSAFESDVLALETQVSAAERSEIVTRLFRGAHSIKGAASAVGINEIEIVCHRMEDLLARARDGGLMLDVGHLELLLAVADALRRAGTVLAAGSRAALGLGPVVERLDRAVNGTGAPPPAAERIEEVDAPVVPAPPRPDDSVAAPASPSRDTTVRVAAVHLDRALRRSSELLIAQNATGAWLDELAALRDNVQAVRSEAARSARGTRAPQRHRGRLREVQHALDRLLARMSIDIRAIGEAAAALDGSVRLLRLQPFSTACEGLERVVRDTARAGGRRAVLQIHGGEIELDRSILDGLRDPLTHLVRNAVDHGIEPGDERLERGKPAVGIVQIRAALRGGGVEVEVRDDGRGIDAGALGRRARELGFDVDEQDGTQAVFLPGISTAATVTARSGRGVGLDVVRSAIETLRGTIDVASSSAGTCFTLNLPLTLTSLRAVLFKIGAQTFAFDAVHVDHVVRIRPESIRSAEGRAVFRDREAMVPLVRFRDVAGMTGDAPVRSAAVTALVVNAHAAPVALEVDELIDEREVVVHTLGSRLADAGPVAGVSILADGSLAPILRSTFVLAGAAAAGRLHRGAASARPQGPAAKRVLLVDDSVTTRTLERSILEAAGYEVFTAGDGREAWQVLESREVDLIVSDVDMPVMDGFALTAEVRRSSRFRDTPVVLVTGRETDADRRRGIDAGADAYIVKSSFDQRELLDALGALL